MTIYYVYKLVHIQTGQFYIGYHCSEQSPYEDLGVKYFTSSDEVSKIGFENFYYGVVDDIFPDHDSCYWTEQLMIKNVIKNPLCLNLHYIDPYTGKDKFSTTGRKLSLETKRKMALAKLGKRRGPMSEEQRHKLSVANLGKKFTEEQKRHLSIVGLGKKHPNYPKHRKKAQLLMRSDQTRLSISDPIDKL